MREQCRDRVRPFVLAALGLVTACEGTKYMGSQAPFAGCDQRPAAPPASLQLDDWRPGCY